MIVKRVLLQPLYPFFIVCLPILMIFNNNFGELHISDIYSPLLYCFGFALGAWLITQVFMRDAYKTSVVILFTFLYTWIFAGNMLFIFLIDPYQTLVAREDGYGIILVAISLLYFITIGIVKIMRLRFQKHVVFCNILAFSFVIIPAISILYKQARRVYMPVTITLDIPFKADNPTPADLPDIYYIIVDRYASNNTLKNIYGYDNSGFYTFLSDNGFYVASDSYANYQFTITSLASSLNMTYLNDVIHNIDPDSRDTAPLQDMLESNEIIRYLKNKGYKYMHFGNGWSITRNNEHADYTYTYQKKSKTEAEKYLDYLANDPQNQLGRYIEKKIRKYVLDLLQRESAHGVVNVSQLLELSKMKDMPGPKFVFVHSLFTHDPYVFHKTGAYGPNFEINAPYDTKNDYLHQLEFANTILGYTIQTLIQGSKTKPIIILQSDEGPYPLIFRQNRDTFDFRNDATSKVLQEKFGILNAFFFPDKNYNSLYSSISPVNTFRVLLNTYFNEELPILPDTVYASWRFYNSINITDKIMDVK